MLKLISLLTFYCTAAGAIQVLIYNEANFYLNDNRSYLNVIYPVSSRNACICECSSNVSCLTATFSGNTKTCVLINAQLSEGKIQILLNMNASVINFPDRIRPQKNPPDTIQWLFDGNFNDVYGKFNGQLDGNNTALWISPGYNGGGQAVYFPSHNYSIVNQYLNLTNTSFTFSAWIWIPSNGASLHIGYFLFITHCESSNSDKCLQIGIVYGKLFLGFYNNDLSGNSNLQLDQWHHVAYVYDRVQAQRFLYIDGMQDKNDITPYPYTGNASYLILGTVTQFAGQTFNNGYVDSLTFVSRVKNSSEILEEATLVAYYTFDNTYADSGPNQINCTNGIGTSFNSVGRVNQALEIHGSPTNLAYFMANGFYFLGQMNQDFSFSMWINPYNNSGTILQIISSNGLCTPIIGFNNATVLTAQISNACSASLNTATPPINTWTHFGMTYSSGNGITLYVNGLSKVTAATCKTYSANGNYTTIIVGVSNLTSLCTSFNAGQIARTQFNGLIDEFKIFSRALNAQDMIQLSH